MKKEAIMTGKVAITQEICIAAKLMYDRGKKIKEIALALGPSESAISHLKTAGWNVDAYLNRKKEENAKAAEKRKTKQEEKKQEPEQIVGQMQMDLKDAEEQKPEMSDQTKMMRFQAHQADRIVKLLEEILTELRK